MRVAKTASAYLQIKRITIRKREKQRERERESNKEKSNKMCTFSAVKYEPREPQLSTCRRLYSTAEKTNRLKVAVKGVRTRRTLLAPTRTRAKKLICTS